MLPVYAVKRGAQSIRHQGNAVALPPQRSHRFGGAWDQFRLHDHAGIVPYFGGLIHQCIAAVDKQDQILQYPPILCVKVFVRFWSSRNC